MTEHADTVGLGYGGSCSSQTLSQEQQVALVTTVGINITETEQVQCSNQNCPIDFSLT